jgi:hypothetical protein
MAKVKTLSEAETVRLRAVTGLTNLGRDDEADRIDGLSAREYAEEKGWRIIENPTRRMIMATSRQLKKRIAELEEENGALQERLDSISEIVGGEEEEDEEEEDED